MSHSRLYFLLHVLCQYLHRRSYRVHLWTPGEGQRDRGAARGRLQAARWIRSHLLYKRSSSALVQGTSERKRKAAMRIASDHLVQRVLMVSDFTNNILGCLLCVFFSAAKQGFIFPSAFQQQTRKRTDGRVQDAAVNVG